jgi:hypothetical protein
MYCKKCGKQIEDDSRFCEYCGASFTGGSQGTQGFQSAPPVATPGVPNVPPPGAPANLKFNDEGIRALISQHRGIAEADTPYFYGYVLPSGGLFFLIGVFAALAMKQYLLNFTVQGIHLYGLRVSTRLDIKDYSFIPAFDIKSVQITDGLLPQWNIKIQFQQNGKIQKMKVKVNKKVIGIKDPFPNIERVKQMFNQ